MKGQWIGDYQGDVDGALMINIDEVAGHFECVAYINPEDRSSIPSSVAYLSTKDESTYHETTAFINPVNPESGYQCKWDDIKHLYPDNVEHSNEAEVTLKIEEGDLLIKAVSDIGVILDSTLKKLSDEPQSKITGEPYSWAEFKKYVSDISKTRYIFRGQKKPWKLRTSFHRKGRYRISEFINKDVKQLHKRLSAITSHYFDLSVPEQNGSFFNLLQHHGYPTPLLDWSYSPFVAAFFAFRDLPQNYDEDGLVRIYIFDNESWQKKYPQIQNLDPPYPHVSVMDFISIDNPRIVPQQAVTTVTNIVDIETHLLDKSRQDDTDYLTAIDIPANEREKVLSELRFMGITAGSMFPSIDGVCEELRELNFNSASS